jgi:hypothetical protein
MKNLLLVLTFLSASITVFPQSKIIESIKEKVTRTSAEAHLSFLAADEMRGRDTGSPEIAIAANYIEAQFKMAGLKKSGDSYFQQVGLQKIPPPKKVEVTLGSDVFKFRTELLLMAGQSFSSNADFVFVDYGTADDLRKTDIKGKIVVAYTGTKESTSGMEAYGVDSPAKYNLVKQNGGLALIEIVNFKDVPWQALVGFIGGTKINLNTDSEAANAPPHLWMKKSEAPGLAKLIQERKLNGNLTVELSSPFPVPGKNVVGIIEGTDPKLKNEYIVLSAHYDHVGVKKNASPDSIYNGARDNGIGTTAILEAASFFASHPAKRSLIIIALCGEEKGLLGSRWYAEHPVIPLSQTVFNLDCDGAGYNDKTIANLIDLNRTTADEVLKAGCKAFGINLVGDPLPEEHLYERSDNFNFAVKGVPAVDFSPGVKAMDAELMKYYHQPPDEVSSLDFEYLEKFMRSYVYAATLLANSPVRPFWKAGDKFEEAGRKLYGKK